MAGMKCRYSADEGNSAQCDQRTSNGIAVGVFVEDFFGERKGDDGGEVVKKYRIGHGGQRIAPTKVAEANARNKP